MSIADAFASIASGFSAAFGGPYHAGIVRTVTDAQYDDGGSISVPGTAVSRACRVQVDSVTEVMRQEPGFTQRDVRLLIIGLAGGLDTDAEVTVLPGVTVPADLAGTYSLQSVNRDSFAIYRECRGRREASAEYVTVPFFGSTLATWGLASPVFGATA